MTRLKGVVKRITQKFLDYADNTFVSPKTIYYLEKGEPQYFNIIGASALNKYKELNIPQPQGAIPIKKDYKVEIEIQSGLGYTREGKKQSAIELGEYLIKMADLGVIPPQAMQKFFQNLLETFEFGATQEIMEDFKDFEPGALTEDQIEKLKVAFLEVIKDLKGTEVFPDEEQRIEEGKIATAEALRDTGVIDKQRPQEPQKGPSRSISFKDLPPEGKEQLAAQAGISLSAQQIASNEQMEKDKTSEMAERELKLKEKGRPNAVQK